MILFVLLILMLCLYKIKLSPKAFYDDFLDRKQTDSIKGVFILFVFLRHALQYVSKSGYGYNAYGDKIVQYLDWNMGQIIVVMFLFYSGYGIMESVKNKGNAYVAKMPRNRILPTLLNFDIAVLCFVVVDLLVNAPITPRQVLLSLICWESIGNSNWYIFVIIFCYTITFLAMKISIKKSLFIIIVGSIIVAIGLCMAGKPGYWYNTILSYPAGILFSKYRNKIIYYWKRKYIISLVCVIGLVCIFYFIRNEESFVRYNLFSFFFANLVLLLNMKIKISNSILCWLGANLFPIYIYQRIPMIILYNNVNELPQNMPFLFMVISLFVTLIIAFFYRFWRVK